MRHHRRVTTDPPVAGLLLAAGAGRRMGTPKALLRHPPDDAHPDGEPWVARAARALRDGGCVPVVVVLGAAAEQARPLLPDGVRVVVADDWDEGMGASLRRGLRALLADPGADGVRAAAVSLVDLPGVTAAVVARLLAAATGPEVLARAGYRGEAGHPVLLGSAHWAAAAAQAAGDAGARGYLAGRDVALVECGDLGSGEDVDRPVGAGG